MDAQNNVISQSFDDNRDGALLIDGLLSRRSVHPKRLIDPAPDSCVIDAIAQAASTAPDHGGLRPWRLLAITEEARIALGETFADIKVRRNPKISSAEIDRERSRASDVPALIAIISQLVHGHPVVPVSEQHITIGAAIQNMLLCAHAYGFGAKMVSGQKTRDAQLAQTLQLETNEALVGFLCIGTVRSYTPFKERPDASERLSYWHPGNNNVAVNTDHEKDEVFQSNSK